MAKLFPVSCVLFLGLSLSVLRAAEAQIGVCYGMRGGNLPSRQEVINMYKQYSIRRMRLYDPNPAALGTLRGSNIEVMLGVPNGELRNVTGSQSYANTWVQNHVLGYRYVNFRYIAVGKEVVAADGDAQFPVPAMQNVHTAIVNASLAEHIKVSTATIFSMIGESSPPSNGSFAAKEGPVIDPTVRFLLGKQAPLLVNLYPYFAYKDSRRSIHLDYSLLQQTQLSSLTLSPGTLDSVYTALERKKAGSLRVVVSESGWPSEGDSGASVGNARIYNNNLVQHVKVRTPKRPGPIKTYIFAMFSENQKTGPELEKHWGLFFPSKQPKYTINFS